MKIYTTLENAINAFTRAAQDPALSSTNAYRLEKAGGQIMSLVRS